MSGRFEYKYLVRMERVPDIRRRLRPFVEIDPYAARMEQLQYSVRSVYFDTPMFRDYHEKIDGLPVRKKLRIRVYNEQTSDSMAFLEIKRKNHLIVLKDRSPLQYRDVPAALATGDVDKYIIATNGFVRAKEGAHKFLYHVRKDHLRPVLLVTYEREAYQGKFDPLLRVTFDKNLRVAHHPFIEELFRDEDLHPTLTGFCIMEVKFQHAIPVWMASIITDHRLRWDSFSKYCIGVDAVRSMNGFPLPFRNPRRSRIETFLKV